MGHVVYLDWYHPQVCLPGVLIWNTTLLNPCYSFVGALLTRFFLGFVEAAFFPGALFLLSKWYRRDELGLRTALLYCGSLLSNGFGALIASGILDGMDGVLGHTAWRYVLHPVNQDSFVLIFLDGFSLSREL